jgi:hypothetical protein
VFAKGRGCLDYLAAQNRRCCQTYNVRLYRLQGMPPVNRCFSYAQAVGYRAHDLRLAGAYRDHVHTCVL